MAFTAGDPFKMLVLGDSHCWDMGTIITERHENVQAIAISKGTKIHPILLEFQQQLNMVQTFDPRVTVIHVGHNELAFHRLLNLHPILSQPTAAATLGFANMIQWLLPNTLIFLSAVFPRTSTAASTMSPDDTFLYNKVAKRHGLRIRTVANRNAYQSLLNNCMWRVVSRAQEEESFYIYDGLHLNEAGKRAVADGWVADIEKVLINI
jgi:lysophospholipase L1-like esterase